MAAQEKKKKQTIERMTEITDN